MRSFRVFSDFEPAGDQIKAISKLSNGIKKGYCYQTLKGVTGSGKTFTMAKVIEQTQIPVLVISHNKTLAAQLYREFLEFFPENAVEYFVSYYDYYQPEAYIPSKDLYIEKDSSINDEIDRMRLSATSSLMERRDVIVVSTVSCIYGLGNPKSFKEMRLKLNSGEKCNIRKVCMDLVALQYNRNDTVLERGCFRVKGDIIEIYPAYLKTGYKIELSWDEIEHIKRVDVLTGSLIEELDSCTIYPAKHFVMPEEQIKGAIINIKDELKERHKELLADGKLLEAQRLESKTLYDIEMMEEIGYCTGIENYSRHLSGRSKGERPSVLLDYFPEDFLAIIDESHVTVPQIGGMYEGDRSRKINLVNYGFRLPSALDNRPMFYAEFEDLLDKTIFVSATPRKLEYEKSEQVVEQIIRPTGLVDPEIIVRSTEGQIEDLYSEILKRIDSKERTLVTTLTKKMSEDLTDYFCNLGLKTGYLHSEVETIERVEILKNLRSGKIDVLIGINLLREGLDLPEVSLIGILDADKTGFLRSATSLIQTIGRASRNVNGQIIMYADRISDAMKEAIEETERRRKIQEEYNIKNNITPTTIKKEIKDLLVREKEENKKTEQITIDLLKRSYNILVPKERAVLIKALEKEMLELAKNLEFEKAAIVRDEIDKIKKAID